MGYQSGALGKSRQGVMEPLPVHVKPGRSGLGVDEHKLHQKKRARQAAVQQGECT